MWETAHKPATQNVVIRFLTDDNAAVNALKSGDVDVLSPVNATLAKSLDASTYTVSAADGSDKFVLAFNCTNAKLKDKRVRQAIRYAINHKEIIASRGNVDYALGGPIPSVDPGYEDLTGLYPYNVDKAKELMKEAGYTTDKPLRLTLTYANTYGTELGDQLKSQLAKIGIDLKIDYVEFSTWLQNVHANGDYELSLVDHAESHDFYKWTTPDYYYHYDGKQAQELYAKALEATDEADSAKYLKQAAKAVSEDAPADWLFGYRVTVAVDKHVQGFPSKLSQTVLPLWRISKNSKGTVFSMRFVGKRLALFVAAFWWAVRAGVRDAARIAGKRRRGHRRHERHPRTHCVAARRIRIGQAARRTIWRLDGGHAALATSACPQSADGRSRGRSPCAPP